MLAGCGGAGGGGSAPAPLAPGASNSTATSASAVYHLGSAASSAALPSSGCAGISGVLLLPAAPSAPAGTSLTLTLSSSAPTGAPSLNDTARAAKSGTLTVFCYATLATSTTITIPDLPGFTFSVPSTVPTTGGSFYYAFSDPTIQGGGAASFRTEGPASVNGSQLSFIPSPNALTLQANQPYVFAFYRTTGPANNQPVLLQNIGIPGVPPASGPPYSFDISFVDSAANRYYLADRTTSGVDVFDTAGLKYLGTAKGFSGAVLSNPTTINNNLAGPNGIVPIGGSLVAAGDGDSTLKIVDTSTLSIVATVKSAANPFTGTVPPTVAAGCVNPAGGVTSSQFRLDELAFDPADGEILAINDADCPPYGTFFSSTPPYAVLGAVSFGTSYNGVEQPIWDPGTHMFYLANPQTVANPNGEIDQIDPHTHGIVKVIPLPVACTPHGLALGPNEEAVIGCNVPNSQILIINLASGAVIGSVPGYGGSDECWYNAGDNRYTCALSSQTPSPLVIVIDAATRALVATFTTSVQAHSVAADAKTNHIFVPQRTTGISVFAY